MSESPYVIMQVSSHKFLSRWLQRVILIKDKECVTNKIQKEQLEALTRKFYKILPKEGIFSQLHAEVQRNHHEC